MDKYIPDENLTGCTGACLLGNALNEVCLRYLQKKRKAVQLKADMNILTEGLLPMLKATKRGTARR